MEERVYNFLDECYEKIPLNLNCTLKEFSTKITPFIHLIDHWASIIGLLLAKCTHYKHRRKIIKNLYDENCSEMTHVETFYSFLCQSRGENIMISMKDILDETSSNPIILKYKEMIFNFVSTHDFDDCCQMLGAIEYTYLCVSNDIAKLYLNTTGKKPNRHYNINDTYQRQHATNFFECNATTFKQNNLEFGFRWIVFSMNELLE